MLTRDAIVDSIVIAAAARTPAEKRTDMLVSYLIEALQHLPDKTRNRLLCRLQEDKVPPPINGYTG